MSHWSVITVLSLSVLLTACVSGPSKVLYEPFSATSYTARDPNQVEVFNTQRPSRPYKELGVLTYRAGTAESYAQVAFYLKIKAAELGADGVIMMGSKPGPSMPIGSVIVTLNDYSAMAIKYSD